VEAQAQGIELNNDQIFRNPGHIKILKNHQKEFLLMELIFGQSCCKPDYKRWIVRKWRLRLKLVR
jgi:hypothetical protein